MKPAKNTSIKVPRKFARTAAQAEAFEAGYVKGLADRIRVSAADSAVAVFASRVVDRFGPLSAGALPIILPELADDLARATVEPEPEPERRPRPDRCPACGGSYFVNDGTGATCADCGAPAPSLDGYHVDDGFSRPAPSSSPPWEIGKCQGCGADVRFRRGDIVPFCPICHAAKPSDNSGYRDASADLPADFRAAGCKLAVPACKCGGTFRPDDADGFTCDRCGAHSGRPGAYERNRAKRTAGEAAIAATGGKLAPETAAALDRLDGAGLAAAAAARSDAAFAATPAGAAFDAYRRRRAVSPQFERDAYKRRQLRAPGLRALRAEIALSRGARLRMELDAAKRAAPTSIDPPDPYIPTEIAGSMTERDYLRGYRAGWFTGRKASAYTGGMSKAARESFRRGVQLGATLRDGQRAANRALRRPHTHVPAGSPGPAKLTPRKGGSK